MSRADVELLRAAGVKPDPGGLATFQRAVVRAWRSEDRRDRQEACREAGESLLRLAAGGAAADLRAVLTPDPVNSNVTWTVACYQIGDLTPSAVRDFADPVAAVTTLAICDDPSHLAAELVASTSAGLRWVALLRTNGDLAFRLPDADAVTDRSGTHATDLADALHRWRGRIADWAEGAADGSLGPDQQRRPTRAGAAAAPTAAAGGRGAGAGPDGEELDVLRVRLADAEQRIIASIDAHRAAVDQVVATGLGQMAVQLAAIERRLDQALAAVEALAERLDRIDRLDGIDRLESVQP